mgnify:CR=1 FL=1
MGKCKKKMEFSKKIALLVFIGGMVVVQECILLIAFAIHKDFTATAAYITAAIGIGELMVGSVVKKYIVLAKSDHSEGGITFEAGKFSNFTKDCDPPI